MGSHMNFKNYGDNNPIRDGSSGKPPPNIALVRQPSIYSLTFDEFQNTMGEIRKDFGSMNMDKLLKNIWIAEETQAMNFSSAGGEHSNDPECLYSDGIVKIVHYSDYWAAIGGTDGKLVIWDVEHSLSRSKLFY